VNEYCEGKVKKDHVWGESLNEHTLTINMKNSVPFVLWINNLIKIVNLI